MNSTSELHSYILRLQRRLRLGAWLRGAAIFTGTALGVTLALVLVLNHFAFPSQGMTIARLVLIAALAAAAIFGITLPLLGLTRERVVQQVEAAHPELEQRLTTFEERAAKSSDPFLELLAADTLRHTEDAAPAAFVPDNRLFALGGAGLACLVVLVWMIAAGPGYIGYGASTLWTGARQNAAPLYAIAVTPGNITVRRNSDQLIVARVAGMQPARARLFAHFQSAAGWEPVTMQQKPNADGGANYQFTLAGLPENVEYYVVAGPLVSPHYKLRVVDLPSVKQINVTYQYPKWTGMKPATEEHSGDLRAIEGTNAQLEIQMDRPLNSGELALSDGQTIHLTAAAGNVYRGTIHMQKDGAYHLTAVDEGQPVRVSEDYFIATDKAQPPQVAIVRPGGDYRASPIEEVTVGVKGSDEFGLKDMHLHYSVNGGPDHEVSVLEKPGAKQADGSHTIALEGLKLVPGDVISVYATARDGHAQAQTDISFIQVDPFEREFTQSQQAGGGGGGGGGGGNQTEISKREKELIAATWKQENDKSATPKDQAAQGQFLSDAQQKLRDQVNALSIRMQSRDISQANQEFTDFDKDMQAAAAAMGPSAEKLKGTQWKSALPLEQKALQALLRAEATFRKIEVAFGQRGGGGGGGGSTGRDLASLFDLELDTEKNQYETAQSGSPAEQRQKAIDDALQKLDALAHRQEDLANQPHDPQQSFQERWQQEMLRRQAEQLQQQMEQMAKNQQQGQQGSSASQQNGQQKNGQQQRSGQQSSSQQSGAQEQNGGSSSSGQAQQSAAMQQGGASGSQGQRSEQASGRSGDRSPQSDSSEQRIEDALNRLQQATGMMRRNGNPQQGAEDARAAAERLREAQRLLAGTEQQMAGNRVDSMAREAGQLAQEERSQASRIDQLARAGEQRGAGSNPSNSNSLDTMMSLLHQRDQLAADRQQLSDSLSKLEREMRNAARDMAPDQPEVAKQLRDALNQMDDTQLGMYAQRTADWLRSGINPNSNGAESQVARGLSQLSNQLQLAQRAMANSKAGEGTPGQRGAGSGDPAGALNQDALNQVERLRSQLEAMARAQQGANGNRSGGDRLSRNEQSRSGDAAQGQKDAGGRNGNARGWNNGQTPLSRNGSPSNTADAGGPVGIPTHDGGPGNVRNGGPSGDTRRGGGGWSGTVWGNYDTGNNTPHARGAQQPVPTDASGNPADTEQSFDQEMRTLRQLRQTVGGDPEAARQLEQITRQMRLLDPKRFPGNPALVEQMHRDLLGFVDRLELQLQRNTQTDARTGKPDAVPAGYQEQVADYYKRLSKK
jgi:hypothetical protein